MAHEAIAEAWIEADSPSTQRMNEALLDAGLRAVLSAEYAHLPTEQLESIVARSLEGLSPEAVESLWSTLKDIGRTVLPVAAPILGTVLGGPLGGAVGGALGQFAGSALGGAPAPSRPPTAPIHSMPRAEPSRSPVTAQLLSFLQNPALLQSLAGQLLGSVGRSSVPVGPRQEPVPFAAFMNALSVLANQAASEARESDGESDGYLRSAGGAYRYDPLVPEQRAEALLEHLRTTNGVTTNCHDSVESWLVQAGLGV